MRETGMVALDASRDKDAPEPSKISAMHCWLCVTAGAVVGAGVIAAVIFFTIPLFE